MAISVLTIPLSLNAAATAQSETCSDSAGRPLPASVGVCADVTLQEAKWLDAISTGDRAAVDAILGPNFTHINSDGEVFDRAQELAGVVDVPFTMNPFEQQVVIAGDAALIHGINVVMSDSGAVLARERFTDVFVAHDGRWLALSAQETSLDSANG